MDIRQFFRCQGSFPGRISSGITIGSCVKEERSESIKGFETFTDDIRTVSNKRILINGYRSPPNFELTILSKKDQDLFDVSLRIIDTYVYDKTNSIPSTVTEWEANISIDSEAVCVLVQKLLDNRRVDLDNKQTIGILEDFYTSNFTDISEVKL